MAYSNRLASQFLSDFLASSDSLQEHSFEALLRYLDATSPLHERLGYSVSLKQDAFRLGQQPMLHFHGSAFANVQQSSTNGIYKLKNAYWGLFGINGPLPTHLTEYAVRRQHHEKDVTLSEFCDLFHHRFISLFYRAWAESQPAVSHDYALINSQRDNFAKRIAAIGGTISGTESPDGSDVLGQFFAGLLSAKSPSAGSLKQVLAAYLQLPIHIEEFVASWISIPKHEQSLLGQQHTRLGQDSHLGRASFQRSFTFAIEIGPLSFADYSALVDNNKKIIEIKRLVARTVGSEWRFVIRFKLAEKQKQQTFLGQSHLGKNAWLCTQHDRMSQAHIACSRSS